MTAQDFHSQRHKAQDIYRIMVDDALHLPGVPRAQIIQVEAGDQVAGDILSTSLNSKNLAFDCV